MPSRHLVLFKDEGRYAAFPDIVRLATGELMVGFRDAPARKETTHIDPESTAMFVKSTDDGRTWSEPASIFAFPPKSLTGIQDPSISQTPKGDLLANFFSWRIREHAYDLPGRLGFRRKIDFPHPEMWTEPVGPLLVRSSDGGNTWSKEVEYIDAENYICTSAPVLSCQDDVLLMPIYGGRGEADAQNDRAAVLRSEDDGTTWSKPIVTAEHNRIAFHEPTLWQRPDGVIICMMRTASDDDHLWQVTSANGGKSWNNLHQTDIIGHPPHLLGIPTSSGELLLCTYGYRHEPYGIRACFSLDGGENWEIKDEIIVREDGLGTDIGYPSTVQRRDGSILTVYYFYGEDGVRYIAGSTFMV